MVFVERSGGNVACADGCFDARIVVGIADMDGQVSGVEFDVLAAGDVFDSDIACGNACVEFGAAWNADFDSQIVMRAAGEMKFGVTGSIDQAIAEIVNLVLIFSGDIHGEFSVLAANDADIAGAYVKFHAGAGRDGRLEMGLAAFRDFGAIGGYGGQGQQGERAKGRKQGFRRYHFHGGPLSVCRYASSGEEVPSKKEKSRFSSLNLFGGRRSSGNPRNDNVGLGARERDDEDV